MGTTTTNRINQQVVITGVVMVVVMEPIKGKQQAVEAGTVVVETDTNLIKGKLSNSKFKFFMTVVS